ncbi:hypothetical protein G0Q01_25640 [Yangia sp. PrR007]|nr:hypothetical protein [Salipiger sp. PrR007]
MDPFLRSVEETFRRHGIEAVLDPEGVARPVRLLPARPDEIADFRSLQVQSEAGMFEILASDFEGFSKGTILGIGSERRKVQHVRTRDPRRYKVLLNTVEQPA